MPRGARKTIQSNPLKHLKVTHLRGRKRAPTSWQTVVNQVAVLAPPVEVQESFPAYAVRLNELLSKGKSVPLYRIERELDEQVVKELQQAANDAASGCPQGVAYARMIQGQRLGTGNRHAEQQVAQSAERQALLFAMLPPDEFRARVSM